MSRYKSCNTEAISHLANSKEYHDELEKYYIKATDFNVVDKIFEDLHSKIMKYTK